MTNIVELVPAKSSPKERLETFAQTYAINGGKEVEAYIEAGFSTDTAKQNAKKYLNKHHEYVMSIVRKVMGQDAAMMRNLLIRCMQDETIPWNNRLKAIEMSLKNSGIQKETLVIEDNKADNMTEAERKQEIKELMERMG